MTTTMIRTRGTCHNLRNGKKLLTATARGQRVFSMISTQGNCHEAAWWAAIQATRLARSRGIKKLVIHSTNKHLVNQMNGVWQARRPMMRYYRALLRAVTKGMTVRYIY